MREDLIPTGTWKEYGSIIIDGYEFDDYGLGWVEIQYEGYVDTPPGIYHCALFLYDYGWTPFIALGLCFDEDGNSLNDKSRIIRSLTTEQIGRLEGHTPRYNKYCGENYYSIYMEKDK